MKKIISVLFAILLAVQGCVTAYSAETARSIVIFEIEGSNVTMTKGTQRSYKASVNQRMANGYTITTGKQSACWLKLDEESLVKTGQNSKIQFGNAKGKKLSISVLSGAITVDAAPQNEGESVEVRAGNSALAIRGTLFVVETLSQEKIIITMLTGSGEVNGITLGAGEVMQIYDMPEDKVFEVEPLKIDETLSLAVLETIRVNIEKLVEAGVLESEKAEEITEIIGDIIEKKQAQINEQEPEEIPKNEIVRPGKATETVNNNTAGDSAANNNYDNNNYDNNNDDNTGNAGNQDAIDSVDVASAKATVETALQGTLTATPSGMDENTAEAYIESKLTPLSLNGVTATVTKVSYTAATNGTAATPSGITGSYVFKVSLSKGSATGETIQFTLNIPATPYDMAMIGDATYSSLAAALDAADLGDTVILLGNSEITADRTITDGVTLEINSNATLTIGDGVLFVAGAGAYITGAKIVNYGTIDIGHTTNTYVQLNHSGSKVDNHGTINLNCGYINVNNGEFRNSQFGKIYIHNASLSNNSAGTFINEGDITVHSYEFSIPMILNEGTFINTGTICNYSCIRNSGSGADFDNENGTITGSSDAYIEIDADSTNIKVADGELTSGGSPYAWDTNDGKWVPAVAGVTP